MVFFCTPLSYWDNPIRVAFRIQDCRNIFAIYNLKFAILVLLIKKRESGNVLLLAVAKRACQAVWNVFFRIGDGDDENSFDL